MQFWSTGFWSKGFWSRGFWGTEPTSGTVYGGSGAGGGTSSWEHYTHEKARRYQELVAKLLAREKALEATPDDTEVKRKKKRLLLQRIRARIAELQKRIAAAEEEYLIMALLA